MKLLNGKLVARNIEEHLIEQIRVLRAQGIVPHLGVLLVGSHPASELYVAKKTKEANRLGIEVSVFRLPDTISTERLVAQIYQLNMSADITGILVQLPLPSHVDLKKVVWTIDAKKDVDGFQMHYFRPPAPQAVIDMIHYYDIPLLRKKITLIGYGSLVGKPLSVLLQKQGANITICDSTTSSQDLMQKVKTADIIISAVGKPKIVTADMVRPGQIVIDAGTASEGGTTVGDVDFEAVAPIVDAITPVPGGIGPLTIMELFKNVVSAAQNNLSKE